MKVLVWSQPMRDDHTMSRRVSSGMLSATSHVLPSSVPAFFHWLAKPEDTDGGTWMIWSSVTARARVIDTPYLLNSSASMPNSVSVVYSGLRSLLPRFVAVTSPPAPSENVSYCAENRGRPPAVPIDARNLKSLTASCHGQNSSSERRYASEPR